MTPAYEQIRLGSVAVLVSWSALTSCAGSVTASDESELGRGDAGAVGAHDGTSGADTDEPHPGDSSDAPATMLPGADTCVNPSPGTAPLRRLSNAEYRNSVRDIFSGIPDIEQIVSRATAEFPAEPESLGFRNSAEFLTVQTLGAQKYMDAAEIIARDVLAANPTECGDGEVACHWSWLQATGAKLYRRPLTADESQRYEGLLVETEAERGLAAAAEWTLYTMLQSPHFLYRVEKVNTAQQPRLLSGTELAARLAYTFWQSTPDDALLQRVSGIDVQQPELVAALAREMLEDERADRLFQFFSEWLDIDRLPELQRDSEVFPNLAGELPRWLEQETHAFVSTLLRDPEGTLEELLTAPYTYVNQGLAEHYGLSDVRGDAFVRVEAPERSGVLTQGFLLAQDKPYRTSIVRRGLKVRSDLLCQNIPAPPNDVPLSLESNGQTLNQRQRLEQHRTDPNCATCHVAMDPIGVVFENFDAVGRYRSEDEDGEAIDASSELSGTVDANGAVRDVRQLGLLLASSQQVRDCYVKQTFRFFFGRETEAADECSLRRMSDAFADSGHNLKELLIAMTRTDAFRYRGAEQEQP